LLTENNNEKLYDLSVIKTFCHGNQNAVKEMVAVFIEEVSKMAQEIRLACYKNDFVEIKRLIHKIKPVISYCAVTKIENELKLIDTMADEGKAGGELIFRIEKLETIIKSVVTQMTKSVLNS
jgi:HPt (histidine-containing phosphotransfer) domain-containing protein